MTQLTSLLLFVLQQKHQAIPVPSIGQMWWTSVLCFALYVGACWVAYRQKRLLFWLAWTIGLLALWSMSYLVGAPAPKIVVWLWSWSTLALPCYWVYRQIAHGDRRPL
jgi:hypothetical protein